MIEDRIDIDGRSLRMYCYNHQISYVHLSDAIGLPRRTLYHYIEVGFPADVFADLCAEFDISQRYAKLIFQKKH